MARALEKDQESPRKSSAGASALTESPSASALAQMSKQQAQGRIAGQPGRLHSALVNPRHVEVRNEVVGVGAREDEHGWAHQTKVSRLDRDAWADGAKPAQLKAGTDAARKDECGI